MGGDDNKTSFAHIPNDQTLFAGVQAIPEWVQYFGNPRGLLLGIVTAALFLPAIVCSFVGDWLCTVFGRKITVYIGSVLIIAGGVWNALATDLGQFAGARVVIGTGGGITKVAAPALLHEIAHPRLRATFGTCYYGFYHLGGFISGLMCIAGLRMPQENWRWRLPCILQIFGPICVIAMIAFAPESPRWLASKERYAEARQMIVKHHANGKDDDPLAEWEYGEICATLRQEQAMDKMRYRDFFKGSGNRKRLGVTVLLGLGSNWVGNGILGLLRNVGITEAITILAINAALAAWNMIVSLTCGMYSERMGRRFMWICSNAGMGFCFCFITGFASGYANTGRASLGIALVPFIFITYGFYDLAWIALNYTYVAEFLSYSMRTKGLAIYITFNNLSNAFNQFVNPYALDAMSWRYYIIYIAIDFAFAFIAWLYFPETRRMSIEEISLVFDYGTKEGRAKALEELHNSRDRAHEEREVEGEGREEEMGKKEVQHIESRGR